MGQQSQLAQIDRIDPICVYFTINERDLVRIVARNKGLADKALAERQVPVEFELLRKLALTFSRSEASIR